MYTFKLKQKSSLYKQMLWLFWFGLPVFIIYIVALSLSKTDLIALPFDDEINPCGAKSNEDLSGYPYIYFSNIVPEGFSLVDTYCVSECPNSENKFTIVNNPSDLQAIFKKEKTFIYYDTFPAFNKVCIPSSFYEFLIVEPALQMSFIQETFKTIQQQDLILYMILFIFITGVVCFLLLLFLTNIMLQSQTTRQIVFIISELCLLGLMINFAILIGESPSISIQQLNPQNEQYAFLSNEQEKKEFRTNILREYFYGINTNNSLSSFMLVYFIIALFLHGGRLLQQEIQLSEYQQSSINPEIFPYAHKIFSDTFLILLIWIIALPILTFQAVAFYFLQENMFAVPQNSVLQKQSLLPFDRYFSSTWQHLLNYLIIYPFSAWVLCITIKAIEFVCVKTTLRQISLIKSPDQQPLRQISFEDRIKQLFIDIYVVFTRYNHDVLKFAIFDLITIIASFLYKTLFIIPIIHGYIDYKKLLDLNDQKDPPKLLKIIWKYWSTDYLRSLQRKQLLKYFFLTQSIYSLEELLPLIKLSNHSKLLLIGKQFESSLTICISFIMTMIFYLSTYNKNDPESNPATPSILTLIWLVMYGITSVCVSVLSVVQQTFIIYSILWEDNSYCFLVHLPLKAYFDPLNTLRTFQTQGNRGSNTQLINFIQIQQIVIQGKESDKSIKKDQLIKQNNAINLINKPLNEKTAKISQTILKKRNQVKAIPQTLIKNQNNPQANDSDASTKASEEDMKSYCKDIACSVEETQVLLDYYNNLKELNGKDETGIQDVIFMCDKNALNANTSISQEDIHKSEEASLERFKKLEEIVRNSHTQTQQKGQIPNSSQTADISTSIALLGLFFIYKSKGFNILLKGPSDRSSNSAPQNSQAIQLGSGQNGQAASDNSDCLTYQKMIIMSGQTDGLGYFNLSATPKQQGQVSQAKAKIVDNLKTDISTCYGVPKESIRLMDFVLDNSGNKVEASFRVPDEFRQKVQNKTIHSNSFTHFKDPSISFSSLIDHFKLSEDLFDSNHNKQWPEAEFKSKKDHRGALPIKGKDGLIKNAPQPYNFPIGWDGFGINMTDIIKWDTSKWFSMESTIDTWIVLYHATKGANIGKIFAQNTNQKKYSADQKAELKPGKRNYFGGRICRINGYPIGGGNYTNVYLADNISSCIDYSDQDGYLIGTKKYQFIFQCRVNPHHVRSPQDKPDYYTVEKLFTKDSIRPYRLLVKEKL